MKDAFILSGGPILFMLAGLVLLFTIPITYDFTVSGLRVWLVTLPIGLIFLASGIIAYILVVKE